MGQALETEGRQHVGGETPGRREDPRMAQQVGEGGEGRK